MPGAEVEAVVALQRIAGHAAEVGEVIGRTARARDAGRPGLVLVVAGCRPNLALELTPGRVEVGVEVAHFGALVLDIAEGEHCIRVRVLDHRRGLCLTAPAARVACPQTMSPAAITTTLPPTGGVAVIVGVTVGVAEAVGVAETVADAVTVFGVTDPVATAVGVAVPVVTTVGVAVPVATAVAVAVAAGVPVAVGAVVAVGVGLVGVPSVRSRCGWLVALFRELNPGASVEFGTRTNAKSPLPVIALVTSKASQVPFGTLVTVESAFPFGAVLCSS